MFISVSCAAGRLRGTFNAILLDGREVNFQYILGQLVALRSAVNSDEVSSLCELTGPLGTIERLIEEAFEWPHSELPDSWRKRWRAAIQNAVDFLNRAS